MLTWRRRAAVALVIVEALLLAFLWLVAADGPTPWLPRYLAGLTLACVVLAVLVARVPKRWVAALAFGLVAVDLIVSVALHEDAARLQDSLAAWLPMLGAGALVAF